MKNINLLFTLLFSMILSAQNSQGEVVQKIVDSYENGLCRQYERGSEVNSAPKIYQLTVFIDDKDKPMSEQRKQKIEDAYAYCAGFVSAKISGEIDMSSRPTSYLDKFEKAFTSCFYSRIGGYYVNVWADYITVCDW